MNLWHLLWMHVTGLGIMVLALLAPFAWAFARDYSSIQRWLGRRLYHRLVREYFASEQRQAVVKARIAKGARVTVHRFEVDPTRYCPLRAGKFHHPACNKPGEHEGYCIDPKPEPEPGSAA